MPHACCSTAGRIKAGLLTAAAIGTSKWAQTSLPGPFVIQGLQQDNHTKAGLLTAAAI
jgi:hypothetical protein